MSGANYSDFSGYSIVSDESGLEQLVFVDLGIWNSSTHLSNPCTPRSGDASISFASNGTRPTRTVNAYTNWTEGSEYDVVRLTGPGTNAKTGARVAGLSLNDTTGTPVGTLELDSGRVESGGMINVTMSKAEAIAVVLRSGKGASNTANSSSVSISSLVPSAPTITSSSLIQVSNGASSLSIGGLSALVFYLI